MRQRCTTLLQGCAVQYMKQSYLILGMHTLAGMVDISKEHQESLHAEQEANVGCNYRLKSRHNLVVLQTAQPVTQEHELC